MVTREEVEGPKTDRVVLIHTADSVLISCPRRQNFWLGCIKRGEGSYMTSAWEKVGGPPKKSGSGPRTSLKSRQNSDQDCLLPEHRRRHWRPEIQAARDHRSGYLAEGGGGAHHREEKEENDSERIFKGMPIADMHASGIKCFRLRPSGRNYVRKNAQYVEFLEQARKQTSRPDFPELRPKFECWT